MADGPWQIRAGAARQRVPRSVALRARETRAASLSPWMGMWGTCSSPTGIERLRGGVEESGGAATEGRGSASRVASWARWEEAERWAIGTELRNRVTKPLGPALLPPLVAVLALPLPASTPSALGKAPTTLLKPAERLMDDEPQDLGLRTGLVAILGSELAEESPINSPCIVDSAN